jgi:Tol biopolymer transport system component
MNVLDYHPTLVTWEATNMKGKQIFIGLLLLTFIFCLQASEINKTIYRDLKGLYLGQQPPGDTPVVFAPGIITQGFHELGISFAPDYSQLGYVISDRSYSLYVIIHLKRERNTWSKPEVAPFSGYFSENSMCFSPSGNRWYFSSKRPLDLKTKKKKKDNDIWYVEREKKSWGTPIRLSALINSSASEMNPSISTKGNLYFVVRTTDGKSDIYFSKYHKGEFVKPVKIILSGSNSYSKGRPFIAPDESYLLFQANRPDGFGGNDLYVTFQQKNESWSKPLNLGPNINSSSSDFGAYVSPDGKYLFFSSYRGYDEDVFKGKSYAELIKLYRSPKNGYATLYWVNARIIRKLKTLITIK